MKKYLTAIILFVVLLSQSVYSIDNFWFKEIAFDSEGQILPSNDIEVRITILNDENTFFQEIHTGVTSDQFGVFTIKVGTGNVLSGELTDIITRADIRIKTETKTENSDWVLSSVKLLSEVQFFSSIMPGFINLSPNHIIIGDAYGNGEDVAVGGDLTATNNGSGLADFQIVADAVTTTEISDGTIQPADLDLGDAANTWTFAGSIDAQSGLDVTGGPLTVVGTAGDATMDFDVTGDGHISGDFTVDGTLNATLAGVLTDGNGIIDFIYNGSSNATVTVELNGPTLSNGASGISINLANPNTWTGTQTFDVAGGYSAVFADDVDLQGNIENSTGTAVTVNDNLVPATTDTYDLGSDALRWNDLWLDGTTIHLGATNDEGTIKYDENNNVLSFAVEQGGTEEQSFIIDDKKTIYREYPGTVQGIARGQYSVDLQIARHVATGVVSGDYSVIAGGRDNAVSGHYSAIVGGASNVVEGHDAVICGGGGNLAQGHNAAITGGQYNIIATVDHCSIIGGYGNVIAGDTSTIGGGFRNAILGARSFIGGGVYNYVEGDSSAIVGGFYNTTYGTYTFIGAGFANLITGDSSVISGGGNNEVSGSLSTIGGGFTNLISGNSSVISGGGNNEVSGSLSTIGGGWNNNVSGDSAAVAGGVDNTALSHGTFVGGGVGNYAHGYVSFVGGGRNNRASAYWWGGATVCGGINNAAINSTAFVGGGTADTASAWNSVVVGGQLNHAAGNNSFIGSGYGNYTNGFHSFIGGGNNNRINKAGHGGAQLSIICGGQNNGVYEDRSFIGGGTANYIFGPTSGIVSGYSNQINGVYSFIGGGMANRASGDSAVVIAGGVGNRTSADYSMILGGRSAVAANYGEFAQASGRFKTQGDAQTSVMVVRDSTVDNTTDVDLKLDGAGADMNVPSNGVWAFRAMVVGADSVAGAAAWEITGLVHPGGFVGTPNVTAIANPAGWTPPQAVLTPPYRLIIRVRGSTAYRTYWVARVEVVQIRL